MSTPITIEHLNEPLIDVIGLVLGSRKDWHTILSDQYNELELSQFQPLLKEKGHDPTQPCPYLRGSLGRVLFYQARYAAGLPLWNPQDNPEQITNDFVENRIQFESFSPLTASSAPSGPSNYHFFSG